ncbi:MAG: sugar ABC transporter permease [Chloroflexi bacterium]|nr:sugar ABC transporter permease [Chloroflexota bacterium]
MNTSVFDSVAEQMSAKALHAARVRQSRLKEALSGYLYTSPWTIGFLLFTVGPLLASLYYSFNRYYLLETPQWIGLGNYTTALFKDRLFWKSVERTLLWSLTTVPLGIMGSFLAALLLNRGVRGTTIWRVCFFLPSLTPQVAATLLWVWILQPDVGIVNFLIRALFGVKGPAWLASSQWALPALVMISLWTSVGSNRMLIFLAGLQGVPEEMYDAALVDGANSWQKTIHVTIPLITPTIFFNLVLGIINSFQVFGMAFVATEGGPAYATYFYALHLYQMAFKSFDMGYGSALAWLLFIALLLLTIVQIKLSGRWVYYAAEVRR